MFCCTLRDNLTSPIPSAASCGAARSLFLERGYRMLQRILIINVFLITSVLPVARAADYYASPGGSGNACSQATPCSMNTAVGKPSPGDTVYLLSGTYSNLRPSRSGTASAWVTFAAAPGALPVVEGGNVGSGSVEYIRYVGIVAKNGSYGGFGNGWTDANCSKMSNSNLEYINCVADGNGINGIAHYCAGGLHIKQSIVAHNGNREPSWSSGVNLFAVQGGVDSNIVEQTISFENIDISSNHSDGSGFIADQNGKGATFVNNIGFHNGGSCIRITNSTNSQIINNTCVHNGQDPFAKYHDEIFFSDTNTTHQGALLRNNLCVPQNVQRGLTMGDGVPAQNNIFNGTAQMIASATGILDFHLVTGSSAIDAGASGSPTPTDEIGFDWKCIKQQSGQAVAWWNYAVDYEYITQIGGVAACFRSGARSGTPDVGAHEFTATVVSGDSGTSGAGDSPTFSETGGAGAVGGNVEPTGGVPATGVSGDSGTSGAGNSPVFSETGGVGAVGGNVESTGGEPATSGTALAGTSTLVGTGGNDGITSVGGTGGSAPGPQSNGCGCRTTPSGYRHSVPLGFLGLCVLAMWRRRIHR